MKIVGIKSVFSSLGIQFRKKENKAGKVPLAQRPINTRIKITTPNEVEAANGTNKVITEGAKMLRKIQIKKDQL